KRLLAYGSMAVLVNLAGILVYQTDAMVVGATLGAAAVTPFAVGAKIPSRLRGLTNAAVRVLAPAASRLEARGEDAAIFSTIVRPTRALLYAGGAAVAYLAAVGAPFLARWQDAHFRGDAAAVQVLLAIGVLPAIAGQPLEHVFLGSNRVRALAVASIVEGLA